MQYLRLIRRTWNTLLAVIGVLLLTSWEVLRTHHAYMSAITELPTFTILVGLMAGMGIGLRRK